MLPEQQQSQVKRLELQKLQHSQVSMLQSSVSHSQLQQHQLRQQQQQFQSIQGGLGGVRTVKLEPQMLNDQIASQQQLQSLQNLGPVKLEPQQNQMGRRIQPVKLEDQHSDEAMLLQQQQLHILQMCGQSSQAATAKMKFLQPQRILQLQQQERQELFKALPQQRCHLQQQFQLQNFPIRSAMRPVYEPGMCARRLTQYMYQQQHRPEDNNIEFWRKFVAEFFTPNAKKKWCVSFYGNSHQTNGVFPQKQLLRFCPGYSKSSMIVVLYKSFFMLICPMNMRIHLVKLSLTMQKQYKKVFLSSFVLYEMVIFVLSSLQI